MSFSGEIVKYYLPKDTLNADVIQLILFIHTAFELAQ